MTIEKKTGDPGYPDEETREIEEEIEEEEKGNKPEPEKKPNVEGERKGEGEEEDKGEEDPNKKGDKDAKKPTLSNRSVRNVPTGRFLKEKNKREKVEKELAELKATIQNEKDGGEKVNVEGSLKEIAESLSVDLDVVKKMYKLFSSNAKGSEISPDVSKKIESIEKTKQELEYQAEDRRFIKEFKRDILPEIKKNFPDVSREQLVKVLRKLHVFAFSDQYHLVPRLISVFRAEQDAFEFLKGGKKGGEGGKSAGNTGRKGGKTYDHELSEEEIDKLSDEEFDEYCASMAKNSKQNKFNKIYIPKR